MIGDWKLLANLLGILIFIVVDYNQSIANNTTYNYKLTNMYVHIYIIYIYSFYSKNNRHVLISQIINSTYNIYIYIYSIYTIQIYFSRPMVCCCCCFSWELPVQVLHRPNSQDKCGAKIKMRSYPRSKLNVPHENELTPYKFGFAS